MFFIPNQKELILRPYQEKAVTMLRKSLSINKKVVLQVATGGGKTIIAASILKAAGRRMRCAFIVDRISLISQASRVFTDYGIDHGIIQGDNPLWDPAAGVQICSIQTLARRKVAPFEFVIIDECHTLFKSHEKIIENAEFVIGLSATPWRKGLGKFFNDLVVPVTMADLMANKDLLQYRVFAPPTIDTAGLRVVAGDYVEKDLAERADKAKITGDIVDHWLKYGRGRKTICFCVNIAHGKHVAREFCRRGIKAVEVNSWQETGKEDAERNKIMREFVEGDAEVITSVDILGKGFDFPGASCAILARPTKSKIVHVQQVGRVLRPGGKEDALILDHAGNFPRLGFVEEINVSSLDDGRNKRSEKKKQEKPNPLPKVCPSCDFLKPAGEHKCQLCGFEPENIRDVEVEAGELKELKKSRKYTTVEKQIFLGGLNRYAAEHGMKQHHKGFYGWALYSYSDKFGCKPSSKMDWGYQCDINEDVKKFVVHGLIKQAKAPATCKDCGSTSVVSVPGKPPHKWRINCGACGKYIKFSAVKL